MPQSDKKQAAAIELLAQIKVSKILFQELTPPSTTTSVHGEELDHEGLFWLFDVLSETFFGGELQMGKNVFVTWENGEEGSAEDIFGYIAAPGAVMDNGKRNAMTRISLNRDLCSLDTTYREAKSLASLIHEMVHAYFVLRCGFEDGEDIHDIFFKTAIVRISEIFRECNEEVAKFLLLGIGSQVVVQSGWPDDHCSWYIEPESGFSFDLDWLARTEELGQHPDLDKKVDDAANLIKALHISENKDGKGKGKSTESKDRVSKMKKLFKRG